MSTSSTQEQVSGKPEAGSRFGLVDHFTVAERIARGKATRADVPEARTPTGSPTPVRFDPVELLEEQAKTRVGELVPTATGRMLVSPFTFYRGAATSWPLTSQVCRGRGCSSALCSFAVTRTSRISGSTRPRTGVSCSTRTISTRHFPVRSNGMSSGSSRALPWRAEIWFPRDNRQRRAINLRGWRLLPQGDGGVRLGADNGCLVLADRYRGEGPRRALVAGVEGKGGQAGRAKRCKGSHQGQPGRIRKLTHVVDGEPRSSATTADCPGLGALHRQAGDRGRTARDPRGPAEPCSMTAGTSSSASGSSTPRGRSWASGASERGHTSSSCSAISEEDPLFLQMKEAEVRRCSSRSSARAGSRTTANEW